AVRAGGARGFVSVPGGKPGSYRKSARPSGREAQPKGVRAFFRFPGHGRDRRAARPTADTVVVPATEPPVFGRVVAQAQAMGRPVVTSDIGILPEHVAAPPEMPEDVRTGWVAKPGDAGDFAHALSEAFALDDAAYRTIA